MRLLTAASGRRAKWLALVLWIALAAGLGTFAGKLQGAETNEPSSYLPGSAESTRALSLAKRFPSSDLTPAVVVYRRPGGLIAGDHARAARDRRAIAARHLRGAAGVSPLIPSRDGAALLFSVPLKVVSDDTLLSDDVKAIRGVVGRGAGDLHVAVTGAAGFSFDAGKVFNNLNSTLLLATGGLVALLLLIIYRSPILWLVPLVTVGFAEAITMAAAYGLAKAGLVVNGQTAGILDVLVFGAGTDYALLIIARYREELARHEDRHEAMAIALRRAAPAIAASGGTVVCALLCLLAAELNSNSGLGPVAAVGIAIVLLAMLTLLPALLVLLGRRAFWPFVPHYGSDPHVGTGPWARMGERIGRRPRRVWVGTVIGLAVLAAGLSDLHLGLSQLNAFRGQVESVQGQRLLAASYPAGGSAPANVVVDPARRAPAARRAAVATPGIAQVGPIERAGGIARFTATLAAVPYGDAANAAIGRLRDRVSAAAGPGALVGGATAQQLDANHAAIRDTAVVMPIVLVVVFVILALLLRALVAPLVLIATVVLSFAAALGLSSVVFHVGFGFQGLEASLPLLSFVFLVALGVDYNIFLMARVREEATRSGTRNGVLRGLAVTGGVITSAGIVLAGTFSVLAVLPLVALTEIGFIVAFGVLLDTLIVRSILVPALSLDIGPALWWPSALARRREGEREPARAERT